MVITKGATLFEFESLTEKWATLHCGTQTTDPLKVVGHYE